MTKLQENSTMDYKFQFQLTQPDILNQWNIYLTQLTASNDSEIEKQMKKLNIPHIQLEITFPPNYPHSPPFIRIVTPKFMFRTGHITMGGSICMELLTNQGWIPTATMASVLFQIILLINEGDGRIDEVNYKQQYSMSEARAAYDRLKATHGWK